MRHWNTLCSSYRSSPYFEFYEDDFYPFFHQKYDFLLDYNQQLLQLVIGLINAPINISYTESFEKKYDEREYLDFRSVIHPNPVKAGKDEWFAPPVYHQVFQEKIGFFQNMSIVDLLFAQGPRAINTLKAAIQPTD